MTTHEPINYLDSILNEEEKRCEYSHEWRNFTISRSGRYKSKNRQRNAVDGKLFDTKQEENSSSPRGPYNKEQDKNTSSRQSAAATTSKSFQQTKTTTTATAAVVATATSTRGQRDRTETYKSYYETNL